MTRLVLPESVEVPGLEVRTWRQDDVTALATAILADLDHLRAFLPWVGQEPLAPAARAALIDLWEEERRSGGDALYGIHRGGRVIGGVGAHHRRAADGLELGYWLAAAEQGRGTMTRVVRSLSARLLAMPGVTHVEICVDEANAPSIGVARRSGFRLLGRERRTPAAPAESGWHQVWRIGDPAD